MSRFLGMFFQRIRHSGRYIGLFQGCKVGHCQFLLIGRVVNRSGSGGL